MRLWLFWVRLFSQREAGTSLALFRIALGLCVSYSLLSIAGAGLVGALWTHSDHGGMRVVHGNWLVQYLGGTTPSVIWSLWTIALCANLGFTLGVGGKVVGRCISLVLLLSYNALITVNPLASGAYDVLITNALWVITLADCTPTLSLHCRRHTGQWHSGGEVSAWPRHVLIFQLLLMYTLTGLQKTAMIWTPAGGYTALYWVTQDPTWMRIDGEFAAWISPLLRFATALTWHWEQLSIILLLWFYMRYTDRPERPRGRIRRLVLRRDWRIGWAAIGLMMHIGILVFLNVGPFSWVSLSYYLLLWHPREWHGFFERVRQWHARRRGVG